MHKRGDKRKDGRKSELFFLLVFFLFSILSAALAVLCLSGVKNTRIQSNFLLFAAVAGLLIGICCVASVWFVLSGKKAWEKGALSFYVLLIVFLGIWLLLQKTGFFEVVKTPEKLQGYLERAGVWMPLSYILLQFLQVVILPIPSVVSTVAGVALFGAYWTMIYSLAGILAGSILAFFIGRKLGNRAVSWMVGEETLKKWQKKLKGKDNLFLSLMFVLPLFPDDILCFLAGLSSMSTKYFLIVILASRILAISATCYSIDFIPFNTWWGIALWCLFLMGIVLAFILIYKNMDKIQSALKRRKNKKEE